jgi:hypothetical protein
MPVESPSAPPIDLVYTWVNGDDPDYQRLCQAYAGAPLDLNPERTRDVYTLLRYSLRSVERFAPWIRHIYLVTCRPQAPEWLNPDHPGASVVHHDEIFDDPRYLPTFSCHGIESYIHRIPGLSDYFLYMNDDFLLGRDITLRDFLTEDGTLLIYGTLFGERIPFLYDNWMNDPVSFLQHTPLLVYKPYYEEMLRLWADEVHKTRSRRFRTRQDVTMHGLYRYYALKYQSDRTRAVPAYRYLKHYVFHKITNDRRRQEKALARINARRPKFYCMNDDQRDQPNPEVVRLVKTFLDNYYPHKSAYER